MRSILKIEKVKILNIKFKKFKNLKKVHIVSKLKITNFFMSKYKEVLDLCYMMILLESIVGQSFKIHKFKFYNNNKKHSYLGVLINLKVDVYKKNVYQCLSYFLIYQLFLYYEFFLKAKLFNISEFNNYFMFNPIIYKKAVFCSFSFFTCWGDINKMFLFPFFDYYGEIFDDDQSEQINYVNSIQVDLIIFYKFAKIFYRIIKVIKKNMLKLLIFFYKKFFIKYILKNLPSKKLKFLFSKKYLFLKKNVKA